ncbi:MAG: TerB family tellurite resistance protein [Vulcanimicrobiota bacterium]
MDDQLKRIVGQVSHGKPFSTTPRDFLKLFGYERRGTAVVAEIRAVLARNHMRSEPDFEELDYDAPMALVYTKDQPPHLELLDSAKLAIAEGHRPIAISVREMLRLFGFERRGPKVCTQVRELLKQFGLTTVPDFEHAPPDSVLRVVGEGSENQLSSENDTLASAIERVRTLLQSAVSPDSTQLANLIRLSREVQEFGQALLPPGLREQCASALEEQLSWISAPANGHRHAQSEDDSPVAASTPEASTLSTRFEADFEYGLIKLLAEIVMADSVAFVNEDEAVNTYILDHLAVDTADAARLTRLYEDCKYDEIELDDIWDYLEGASAEDAEALFDACCKVAWADGGIDDQERQLLTKICTVLHLDESAAQEKIDGYGRALQTRAQTEYIYTHVETVEVARVDTTASDEVAPEWLIRTLQLLAMYQLLRKRTTRVELSDTAWRSSLGDISPEVVSYALDTCSQLTRKGDGYVPSPEFRLATTLGPNCDEALLLSCLLNQGSPLTARFLSFRIAPPKPFPESELRRLAAISPALELYSLGNGKWLGATAWGVNGALHLVKEDWALIKRDLKKKHGELSSLEWEAVLQHARATDAPDIAEMAESALRA